jgi:hypothetical protein
MVKGNVYDSWTDEEYQTFINYDWGVEGMKPSDWCDMMADPWEKQWNCQELIQSIKLDLNEGMSIEEIKVKYYKK